MCASTAARAAGASPAASDDTPADAVRNLSHLVSWQRADGADAHAAEPAGHVLGGHGRSSTRQSATAGATTEPEAKVVLAAFGVPTVETVAAGSPEEAEERGADMLPRHPAIVVKLLSRDVTHRSDVGGSPRTRRCSLCAASRALRSAPTDDADVLKARLDLRDAAQA
jgi:acetyltransferase